MRLRDFLERLDHVRPYGGGWTARCPAHEDKRSSLAVAETEDRLLVHCFAGCTVERITDALGLVLRDLFEGARRDAISVEELAFAKRLPAELLLSLGVRPLEDGGLGIPYRGADGEVLCMRRRTAVVAKDGSSWIAGTTPTVYGADRLAEAKTRGFVILVEGESDCWTLWHHGFPALGVPGATLAKAIQAAHLDGIARVYIFHEPDAAGDTFLVGITRQLAEIGFSGATLVVALDGFKDPNELHKHDPDAFASAFQRALDGATPIAVNPLAKAASKRARATRGPEPEAQATLLVELARAGELFHTPDGDVYSTANVDGRIETRALHAADYRSWLALAFYDRYGQVAHAGATSEALQVLHGLALRGPERPVHTRMGKAGDAWYVFLADEERRAVEITPDGWKVVRDPVARFRKPRSMHALPEPVRGGSLDELRPLINLASEDDWLLVRAWLLAAICPVGPYPALGIHGEQGGAKSTLAEILRLIVDPNAGPLRAEPSGLRDLMITALSSWVIALDNLSRLPDWLSNALCRMSTGGAIGARELYTNTDEILIHAWRPVILTGIQELAGENDLLERTIVLQIPHIPRARRRTREEILRQFGCSHARILGALLDIAVEARRNLLHTEDILLPRMADFARLATAAEPAFGVAPGAFLRAFEANESAKNELAFEASPIATALLNHARRGPSQATANDLLVELSERVSEAVRKSRSWPTTGRAMAAQVRRMMPHLRGAGVEVTFERAPGGMRQRLISFEPRVPFEDLTMDLPLAASEGDTATPPTSEDGPALEEVLV